MSKPRPDQRIRWSKREKSLIYGWERDKTTSMLIAHFIEGITIGDVYGHSPRDYTDGSKRTLAQELDARGYDLTTLRFSIRRKDRISALRKVGGES